MQKTSIRTLQTPPPKRRVHESFWKQTLWTPHDAQREILLDPTRNQVVSLGRRAGKSHTGGHKLVPEYLRTFLEVQELQRRGQRRNIRRRWLVRG
jgi:hypothetical protein